MVRTCLLGTLLALLLSPITTNAAPFSASSSQQSKGTLIIVLCSDYGLNCPMAGEADVIAAKNALETEACTQGLLPADSCGSSGDPTIDGKPFDFKVKGEDGVGIFFKKGGDDVGSMP